MSKNMSLAGSVLSLMILLVLRSDVNSQTPLRFDQIVLKGTHNSYASRDCGGWFGGNDCPVMHDSPADQIDDWGVSVLELDFSFAFVPGYANPIPYVGHDGWEGCDSWADETWTGPLRLYLERIKNTRSFNYRPVIIKFEYKKWGLDAYDDPTRAGQALEVLLWQVFGDAGVFGPRARDSALLANEGKWPTVRELAGKILPWNIFGYSSDRIYDNRCPLPDNGTPNYTDLATVQGFINAGAKVIYLDQYQADWTFQYADPPNPLYVSSDAATMNIVANQYGMGCFLDYPSVPDPTNPGLEFVVFEQGTFRFPFRTVEAAVEKSVPGWTILIQPGNYPEAVTISTAVTLKADGGTVTIGK